MDNKIWVCRMCGLKQPYNNKCVRCGFGLLEWEKKHYDS